MAGKDDVSLFRHQVRTFRSNLLAKNAHLNAENNTDFALQLLSRAERTFGKREVKENVSEFYNDNLHSAESSSGELERITRNRQLIDSMTTLLSFLDYHLGDPIAMELFSNTLDQAREVLKQDMTVCSVLLCRMTMEQSMRRLCGRNSIEIEPRERADSMRGKLAKADIFRTHESKELDAKLTYSNRVVHGELAASTEDANKLIEWTDKFISRFLEGSG